MDLQGKFLQKGELRTFESGYQSIEFYLDCKKFNSNTGEPIENLIKLQLGGSKIELLQGIQKGDKIKVYFNVQGRVYDKKDGSGKGHAQNLEVWKIDKVTDYSVQQSTVVDAEIVNDNNDDLPF